MAGHHWQVWQGEDMDNVVFEGSQAACRKYYRQHGGIKAGLHIGYNI
jgi:azurin